MLWAALAFCLLAVLGSLAYAVARALRLWRTVRATARSSAAAIGKVTTSAASAEAHATSLTANAERLSGAGERLSAALAELTAIRAAAAEPSALLASIRGAVPRK